LEKSFNLEIISPIRTLFKGDVNSVIIPGTLGSFQVLKNHAPLVSSFEIGLIKIQREADILEYSTSGGIFEVKNNKAIILAETIESKEEIDLSRARNSKSRAEQILKMGDVRKDEKSEAKVSLQKAINRIKVAEKK
jgi:F-type H+-transporting ATPase subunit epsilon